MPKMFTLIALSPVFLLLPYSSLCQFPAACNTPTNLQEKTCCPNDCSGVRGSCSNVIDEVVAQWELANSTITDILRNSPNLAGKGTADGRYLWPTVIFENVCICNNNYGGFDCSECDFGWTGDNCTEKKQPVVRQAFHTLTDDERDAFVQATMTLKSEMGYWSAITAEPVNYTSGTVTLQNISTYNFFVLVHNYGARDGSCRSTNDGNIIDFSHSGPAFPVWHRRYLMIVEKEFQRVMNDASFGFPYWQWEENDRTPFNENYFGGPPSASGAKEDVMGTYINPQDWNTICDLAYYNSDASCSESWTPCNPETDLGEQKPLQRGGSPEFSYIPNDVEIKMSLAAPSYDAANADGTFLRESPRTSFRSRMEGWNIICSAELCTGPLDGSQQHMHNGVHVWVGGHMDVAASAVNDPVFNLHHCNIDRILESWMRRFATESSNPDIIPAYAPVKGGHPGHNRDDYIVPIFPLIKVGRQYTVAEEWGYTYDSLIPADIPDNMISNCEVDASGFRSCPICDASTTCINCTSQTCPAVLPIVSNQDSFGLGLGLGLGLGIPLLIAIAAIAILIVVVVYFKMKLKLGVSSEYRMTSVKT